MREDDKVFGNQHLLMWEVNKSILTKDGYYGADCFKMKESMYYNIQYINLYCIWDCIVEGQWEYQY